MFVMMSISSLLNKNKPKLTNWYTFLSIIQTLGKWYIIAIQFVNLLHRSTITERGVTNINVSQHFHIFPLIFSYFLLFPWSCPKTSITNIITPLQKIKKNSKIFKEATRKWSQNRCISAEKICITNVFCLPSRFI